MTNLPTPDIMESTFRTQVVKSDKLKEVMKMYNWEINQKGAKPSYDDLRRMVNTYIENSRLDKAIKEYDNPKKYGYTNTNQVSRGDQVPKENKPCRHWAAKGACKLGDACAFFHDPSKKAKAKFRADSPSGQKGKGKGDRSSSSRGRKGKGNGKKGKRSGSNGSGVSQGSRGSKGSSGSERKGGKGKSVVTFTNFSRTFRRFDSSLLGDSVGRFPFLGPFPQGVVPSCAYVVRGRVSGVTRVTMSRAKTREKETRATRGFVQPGPRICRDESPRHVGNTPGA
jgi:hypothetical protein